MKIKCLILLAGVFFPFVTFSSQMKYACNKTESMAVRSAITHYLDKNSGIHSQDVKILKMKCFKQYASAIVHPKKPITDDATVYLHKNKTWKVLSMGTDFDKDLLKQIPKEIRTF